MNPITGVAIRFQEKIYAISAPARHCHVIQKIVVETGVRRVLVDMHIDQGFVDSEGVYLNRYEALERARQTGQLKYETNKDILFSEDVW